MKTASFLAIAALSGVMLSGCDQRDGDYSVVRSGNRTFLLNKATGQTQAIEGLTLMAVKAQEVSKDDEIGNVKAWPDVDLPQLSGIKVSARTKYRDGQILYSVTASPYKGQLENGYLSARAPSFNVELLDADSFPVGSTISLSLSDATQVVDVKGNASGLVWTGSRSMSPDVYRAASSLNVGWAGFPRERDIDREARAAIAAAEAAAAAEKAAAEAMSSTE